MDFITQEGDTVERVGHVALARQCMDSNEHDWIFVQEHTADGDLFLKMLKMFHTRADQVIPFDWSASSRRAA
jgi:hypothetical protein